MKIRLVVELHKNQGPSLDEDTLRETLIEEIEGLGSIWYDDTEYDIAGVLPG